jgi:hypothetical protein
MDCFQHMGSDVVPSGGSGFLAGLIAFATPFDSHKQKSVPNVHLHQKWNW